MAKRKTIDSKCFSWKELVLTSQGKLGRHMDTVRTGTGIHKSQKTYSRKIKHKKGELE